MANTPLSPLSSVNIFTPFYKLLCHRLSNHHCWECSCLSIWFILIPFPAEILLQCFFKWIKTNWNETKQIDTNACRWSSGMLLWLLTPQLRAEHILDRSFSMFHFVTWWLVNLIHFDCVRFWNVFDNFYFYLFSSLSLSVVCLRRFEREIDRWR